MVGSSCKDVPGKNSWPTNFSSGCHKIPDPPDLVGQEFCGNHLRKSWEDQSLRPPSDGGICAAQSAGTFATDKQVLPGLAPLLFLSTSSFPLSASFTNSEAVMGPSLIEYIM